MLKIGSVMADDAFSLMAAELQREEVRRVIADACARYAKDTVGRDKQIAEDIVNICTD